MSDSEATTIRFVDEAAGFCALVSERKPTVEALRRSLVTLVAAALELRPVEPTDADHPLTEEIGKATARVVDSVRSALGAADRYWEVFDPRVREEPVAASLADDIGDIFRDLRTGLALHAEGHPADAIWHWRFTFEMHWGDHATDALRALHRLATDEP